MSTIAVEGVTAAGRVPTWIIPAALVTAPPTEGTWSIPLSVLTNAAVVKADCYYDLGDVNITRTAQTRTRQRACQQIAQTIKTGETIDVTVAAVYDQQEAMTEDVNLVYAAVPEGADVYVARAYGWDSSLTPTASTVIDLVRGDVQSRMKNEPTSADEDLKFTATLAGSAFYPDVALTA